MEKEKRRTFLHDAVDTAALSTHSLESDDFSRCFQPKSRLEMDSSGMFYVISFIVRYCILFPIRLALLALALLAYACMVTFALYYNSDDKIHLAYIFIIKALAFIFGARLRHHGIKKRLDTPHIFVANHTSFVDFILLSSYKFPHACVSENHGGLFSFVFNAIFAKNGSIAFKRCENLDRAKVKKKMIEHVAKNKLPMLVFPEGTCVNNEYSVMFQKGVFELDVDICPVSIRYDRRLMDPYWNRRSHGFALHLCYLLSRWFIEADIYWLPPVRRGAEETPAAYALRTKSLISEKANLRNSLWNGYLKSSPAIKDRELLKVAFKRAYGLVINEQMPFDAASNSFMADQTSYYDYFIYGKISYKRFINEMLVEYHRLKCMPSKDQQVLISDLVTKSSSCLNLGNITKKGCDCKRKAKQNFKKKYKYKTCGMESSEGSLR